MLDTYVLDPSYHVIDIIGREFIELFVVAKDDHSDIDGTEDREFVRFLEQAAFALEEGAEDDN